MYKTLLIAFVLAICAAQSVAALDARVAVHQGWDHADDPSTELPMAQATNHAWRNSGSSYGMQLKWFSFSKKKNI